jgi:hypothetical protein
MSSSVKSVEDTYVFGGPHPRVDVIKTSFTVGKVSPMPSAGCTSWMAFYPAVLLQRPVWEISLLLLCR